MSSREIEVDCPCCSARLVIDVRTSRVMKTLRKEADVAGAPTDRWSAASDKVRERTTTSVDKLESALENERGKSQRFDELFRKATEKHGTKDEEPEDGAGR